MLVAANKKNNFKVVLVITYAILILGVLATIGPFLWMILTSFKTQSEAMRILPILFPSNWHFDNYMVIFEKLPFGKIYLNTIISSVVTVVAQLLFCSMSAYAFGRIEFPGRNVIFLALLAVLMVPSSFFLLPQYLIIQKVGLLNTIPALFMPNLFSAFGTFLLRQFFISLPDELEDAAKLDGCNHFRIYSRIMLPLIKPGLTALGILSFKFSWNDLMWPLIVNTSTDKMTLSAGLSYLQGQYSTDYPAIMGGAFLSMLPLLIMFAVFQKQFIEGIALTGIKD
ncbi:MAG: carbohydrate ABC transporter permease [Anaerocolumna sp.]